MATATASPPAGRLLVRRAGKARAEPRAMLAQVHPGGVLELLDAEAWARALGYTHEELGARSLRELMGVDDAAAREIVAALLDENAHRPLDVTLRCKGGERKVFTFYRRFDAYAAAMFVLADEQGFATEQTGPAPAPTMTDGEGWRAAS